MEGGEDGFSLPGEDLPVGGVHRRGDLCRPAVVVLPPAAAQLLRAQISLAAAGVRAGGGIFVGLCHQEAVEGVRPCRHRLGLQGRGLEGSGHLRGHHPQQVIPQAHALHPASEEDVHRDLRVVGDGAEARRGFFVLRRRCRGRVRCRDRVRRRGRLVRPGFRCRDGQGREGGFRHKARLLRFRRRAAGGGLGRGGRNGFGACPLPPFRAQGTVEGQEQHQEGQQG